MCPNCTQFLPIATLPLPPCILASECFLCIFLASKCFLCILPSPICNSRLLLLLHLWTAFAKTFLQRRSKRIFGINGRRERGKRFLTSDKSKRMFGTNKRKVWKYALFFLLCCKCGKIFGINLRILKKLVFFFLPLFYKRRRIFGKNITKLISVLSSVLLQLRIFWQICKKVAEMTLSSSQWQMQHFHPCNHIRFLNIMQNISITFFL